MANITENLNAIKNARYGKDVRNAIHDSIQAMNTESSNAQQVAIESQTSCLASKNASAESERLAHVYMEQAMSGTPDGYNSFHNAVTLGRTSILIPSNKFANCVGYKDDNKVGTYTIGATVNLTNAFGGGTISFGFADENGADDSASGMYTFDNWSTGVKSFTASISNTATKYKYLKITLTDCTLVGVGLVEGTVANYKYTDEIPLKPILDTLTLGSTIQTASATDLSLSTSEGGIRVDKVVGKTFKSPNLYDWSKRTDGKYITDDGTLTDNKASCCSGLISAKANTTYSFGITQLDATTSIYIRVHEYDSSGNWLRMKYKSPTVTNELKRYSCTFKTSSDCVYIRLSYMATHEHLMLNESATELPWMIYGEIVSSGSYGCVDLGSLTWTYGTASGVTRFKASYDVPKTLNTSVPNAYCNEYNVNSFTKIANSSLDRSIYFNQESNGICIVDTRFTDASLFTEHLKGTLLAYSVADGQTPSMYAEVWEECGKNFARIPNYTTTLSNGVTIKMDRNTNTISYHGTVSYSDSNYHSMNGSARIGIDSKIKGKTVTVSVNKNPFNPLTVVFMKYSGTSTQDVQSVSIPQGVTSKTFVVSDEAELYGLSLGLYKNGDVIDIDDFKIQIELGEEATEFAPYHKPNTVILPLAEPLYKDNVVSEDGVTKNSGVINSADVTWSFNANLHIAYQTISTMKNGSDVICDKYTKTSKTDYNNLADKEYCMYVVASNYYIFVRDDSCASADDFKNTNTTFVYELKNSTTTPLTSAQSKALHSVKSFSGKTVITSQDLADAKPTLSVSYGTSDAVAQALLGVEIAKSNQAMIEEQIAEVQAMILELETTV